GRGGSSPAGTCDTVTATTESASTKGFMVGAIIVSITTPRPPDRGEMLLSRTCGRAVSEPWPLPARRAGPDRQRSWLLLMSAAAVTVAQACRSGDHNCRRRARDYNRPAAAPRGAREIPMTTEQESKTAATTRMVIDRFNQAFNRHDAD